MALPQRFHQCRWDRRGAYHFQCLYHGGAAPPEPGVGEAGPAPPFPDSPEPERTALLDQRLLATPAVAVQRAHEITCRMARDAIQAFQTAVGLTHTYDQKKMDQLGELEAETDHYEDALGTYLVKLSGESLAVDDNRRLNTLLFTISDFERIADHAVAIGKAAKEIKEKPVLFSEQAKGELATLERAVGDILNQTVDAFAQRDLKSAAEVESQEQVVDWLVHEIKSRHVERLRQGTCTVEYGFVLEDLLTAYERIADHCSSVAVESFRPHPEKWNAMSIWER